MGNTPVLLIAAPTNLIGMPAIGVSLLKAQLKTKDINCEVFYSNAIYADLFGAERLNGLLAGNMSNLRWEELFAPLAHGKSINIGSKKDALLLDGRNSCERLLETILGKIEELKPKIVGFSNSYMATNASIAVGKLIKKRFPECLYVVGGNNCEGPMGEELARSVGFIDYVFQGEAEFVFSKFCENYLKHGRLPENKVISCPIVKDLNTTPVPDYSDYFKQNNGKIGYVCLSFETSRGCWWGQKNRCKFCGETPDLTYRKKSPDVAVNELLELKKMHPDVKYYCASDAILPQSYYQTFLPLLADQNLGTDIIYEIKSKLSKEQAQTLKKAGVNRILAGIESLSTRLLGLLGKGTTVFDNLRLLRNCQEAGIFVSWTNLVGVPNDLISDYEEQERIIELIEHLSPSPINPIRIQRFSPYFESPGTYQVKNIKPLSAYFHIFPEQYNLNNLAYYFTAEFPSESIEKPKKLSGFKTIAKAWEERWYGKGKPPVLSIRKIEQNKWEIKDTRSCAIRPKQYLDDEDQAILTKTRSPQSLDEISTPKRVERLIRLGYLIEIDKKIISIVCGDY